MAKAAKKEDPSLQRLTIVALTASIIGIFALFWYVSADTRPFRRQSRSPLSEQPLLSPLLMQSPGRSMFGTPGFGPQPVRVPQSVPRYFANLTTPVGEYIVSVRQVADFDNNLTLYENALFSERRPPLARVSLSIQVMSASDEAIKRIREFAPTLKVTDNKGGKQQSADLSRVAEFVQGKARLLVLPPPTQNATHYTMVEGAMTVRQDDGTEKQIPFTLTNVPLPSQNHLFGLASANPISLSPTLSKLDADGKGIIQGEPAYAFEETFPPFTPESGPLKQPNRLILIPEIANRFPLALPTPQGELPLLCTLIYHPEPESRNRITIRLEAPGKPAKPLEWKFDAYENEPLILTFAANHFVQNLNQTAGLRLNVFCRPNVEMLPTVSPILADAKAKSGSLVVAAKVEDRPLRFGKAKMEIVYRDGNKTQRGNVTMVLNEEGMGRVHNLPPGNYEVVLKELMPYHNNMTPQPDGMQALTRRYHLQQPKVVDQIQSALTLSPGGQITLKPWRVVESGVVAKESAQSLP